MAIQRIVRIQTWAISDGRNTSFALDLIKNPYWIGSSTTSGIGGRITNWFADNPSLGLAQPVNVAVVAGADSATLAGTIVTIIVPVKPTGFHYIVTLDLIF